MAVLMREAIGGSLRRARTEGRRTLREVSRRARVSLGYLSEVERGRKEASSELLAAICEALEVSLSDVLAEAAEVIARRWPPTAPRSSCPPGVRRAAAHGSAPGRGRSVPMRLPPDGPDAGARGAGRRLSRARHGSVSGRPGVGLRMIPDIVHLGWKPDRTGATMGRST